MADIYPFLIDGDPFPDVPVYDFDIHYSPQDGSGSGRMDSVGIPLFRQPYGTVVNADIYCGLPLNHGENQDFKRLINILIDFGVPHPELGDDEGFHLITLVTPAGIIKQPMYSADFTIKGHKIKRDGTTYWGTIPIKFRAQKAYYI